MSEPVECVGDCCEGVLTLVEAESGVVWGGVCTKCGKHNEKCQACGRFFVQMSRHLKLVEPWPGMDKDGKKCDEPEERVKRRLRAKKCLDGNPLHRTARLVKDFGKGAP